MKRRDEPIPALSAGLSHVMMTGLLLLAVLPLPFATKLIPGFSPPAKTQDAAPAPAVSPEASAAPQDAAQAKDEWPEADVVQAKEQCTHLLSGIAADFEMLEPIKKGQCGLPAPLLLKSIGSGPTVVFDPPVEVNCRMVAALSNWVKSTLQPKAREQLKSPVVRVVGASGYSCRNIYNLPNARLSQHALANAIDIGGFALESGRTIWVVKGWGPTVRDIKAAQAKAKAEAEAKAKAARSKKGDAEAKGDEATNSDAAEASAQDRPVAQASLTPVPPVSALHQKKPALVAVSVAEPPKPPKPTKEALFLRALHDGACHDFGTVLGPEANDPHRNHFHLDLIPRKSRGYCE